MHVFTAKPITLQVQPLNQLLEEVIALMMFDFSRVIKQHIYVWDRNKGVRFNLEQGRAAAWDRMT